MASAKNSSPFMLVFFINLILIPYTYQLQTSHSYTLLRIQQLLNFPPVLSSWSNATDFCQTETHPSLTVVCYEDRITQLHIIGDSGTLPLPPNFSIESFFTTIVRLPTLKVLSLVSLGLWGHLPNKIARFSSLEILNISSNFFYDPIPQGLSALRNLQTLILDNNKFTGHVPEWLSALPVLNVLSLVNNSLTGHLPESLETLENLRVLALSTNHLSGEIPDLSSLKNLQVLDLENNHLGPQFPTLGRNIATIILRNNSFSSGMPSELISYHQLQRLDISLSRFVGPFLPELLSMPSLTYLNIAENKFKGKLSQNMSCSSDIGFVDLSSNLLSGDLPTCLLSSVPNKKVLYGRNCLATNAQNQHPHSFCQNEALAVDVSTRRPKKAKISDTALIISSVGAVSGGIMLVGLIAFLVFKRLRVENVKDEQPSGPIAEHASNGFLPKIFSDPKTNGLLPPYRTFSLEELEEATCSFDTSCFIGEGSHGQIYRGRLNDDSLVVIKCLNLKKRESSQNFMHHIELMTKLRHCNLASALGHCFEYYSDDSTVNRLFLVFEYVSNGTLRDSIFEAPSGRLLDWPKRIASVIGVAKGIQFLQTGVVPGIFGSDLKITDILLDQNLVPKISSYKLPVFAERTKNEVGIGASLNATKQSSSFRRNQNEDNSDVYDLGVILLEVIVGSPLLSNSEVDFLKGQLETSITADDTARKNFIDPTVRKSCSNEALKTVMGLCIRCLSKDAIQTPSIEDILWNLHYAAQVQDAWRGDSFSSDASPILSSRASQSQLEV